MFLPPVIFYYFSIPGLPISLIVVVRLSCLFKPTSVPTGEQGTRTAQVGDGVQNTHFVLYGGYLCGGHRYLLVDRCPRSINQFICALSRPSLPLLSLPFTVSLSIQGRHSLYGFTASLLCIQSVPSLSLYTSFSLLSFYPLPIRHDPRLPPHSPPHCILPYTTLLLTLKAVLLVHPPYGISLRSIHRSGSQIHLPVTLQFGPLISTVAWFHLSSLAPYNSPAISTPSPRIVS